MGRTGRLARIGGVAALCLPPVMIALLGLVILERERRRGLGRRRPPAPAAAARHR